MFNQIVIEAYCNNCKDNTIFKSNQYHGFCCVSCGEELIE